MIHFYNSHKFGVDLVNEMIDHVSYDITTNRWPLKLFNFLIDVVSLNSFVLYKQHLQKKGYNIDYDDSMRKKFLYALSDQLMSEQMSFMESSATSHIYKSYKEVNDKIKAAKKKHEGLLPSTVKWCSKDVNQEEGHSVREDHLLNCDHCNKPACDKHVKQKVYCISCSGNIKFDNDIEEEVFEPISKRTRSQTQK